MDKTIKLVWIAVIIAVFAMMLSSFICAIGSMKTKNGCYDRYSYNTSGDQTIVDTTHVHLQANGNYDNTPPTDQDPAHYGKWLGAGISFKDGQTLGITVSGYVSLCKAKLPATHNIRSPDSDKTPVEIPRVEDFNTPPLALYFDAKIDEWRNIASITLGDKVIVSLASESKDRTDASGALVPASNVHFTDVITNKPMFADCSDQQKTIYSPICGKYSPYGKGSQIGGHFVTACTYTEVTPPPPSCDLNACYYYTNWLPPSPNPTCIPDSGRQPLSPINCDHNRGSKNLCIPTECAPNNDKNYYIYAKGALQDTETQCSKIKGASVFATPTDTSRLQVVVDNNNYLCEEDGQFFKIHDPGNPRYTLPVNQMSCNRVRGAIPITFKEAQDLIDEMKFVICHNDKPLPIPTWVPTYTPYPMPYMSDGTYNFTTWSDTFSTTLPVYGEVCSVEQQRNDIIDHDNYMKDKKFWFSANDAGGLLYRFDTSATPTPTNIKQMGSDFKLAKIQEDQSAYNDPDNRIIYNVEYLTPPAPVYLQYRFLQADGQFSNNTGGYILNIKQTTCRAQNGLDMANAQNARGKVEYILLKNGVDANAPGASNPNPTLVDVDNKGTGAITLPNDSSNYQLWLRIHNDDPAQYPEGYGYYDVGLGSTTLVSKFSSFILTPLFYLFKTQFADIGGKMFGKMTCYKINPSIDTCTNFFSYIRAMLILFVATYGAMFSLGMSQLDQKTVAFNLIKVLMVAGLLNETTFDFFNNYLVYIITNFSDGIIMNISGYNTFTGPGTVTNPFMFMDALMTNILFNPTFLMQLLALLSLGISGVLYFIIVLIAVIVMLVCALRCIAVYLMAFMAVCLLIAIAPIFITFILFNPTRYLFDNWVKMTVKYMFEPVMMLVGVIILTQLFTIYLDFVLGYSVCWKCVLNFKIPFPNMPGFTNIALLNLPVFCLNWFAPWGLDSSSGMMGVNMQHMVALVIIAFTIHGYLELSNQMVVKIVGGGGPSATNMGQAMASNIGQAALKPIGMDKEGRKKIQGEAKKRLADRKKANKDSKGKMRDGGMSDLKPDASSGTPGASGGASAPSAPSVPTPGAR